MFPSRAAFHKVYASARKIILFFAEKEVQRPFPSKVTIFLHQ